MFKRKKVDNKKILESKRLIREAQEKIRLEKINIKKSKKEEFRKTKFYKFLKKSFKFINFEKDTYSFSEVLVVMLLSLLLGAFTCFSVLTIISGGRNYLRLSKELSKFIEVYEIITENYNGDVNKDVLIEEAINGMISSVGDEYTGYYDSSSVNDFNSLVNGVYEGIGCTISMSNGKISVVEVFENGPAYNAGLLAGDVIVSVDGKKTEDMKLDEVSDYIKNKAASEVEIEVLRNEKKVNLQIVRGSVETPVVTSKIHNINDKKIGYLGISVFSMVASNQFESKLKQLEKEDISGLIIDVRGNNGGYLSSVNSIVSQLLPKGEVIYQIEKDGNKESFVDKTLAKKTYPIAVITNGSSASASEILAAAIKESYGGYVVGTKTYGKGTVQQTKTLSDGTMIKVTVENWLTPDGNWVNDVGIEPTHHINMDASYYDNPSDENDTQLQKALELVTK